jgi:hypothetical protein
MPLSSTDAVSHIDYGSAGSPWTLWVEACYLDVCQGTPVTCNGPARSGALAHPVVADGVPGVIIAVRGRPVTVMAFTVTDGSITAIRMLTDPDRLAQIVPSWVA